MSKEGDWLTLTPTQWASDTERSIASISHPMQWTTNRAAIYKAADAPITLYLIEIFDALSSITFVDALRIVSGFVGADGIKDIIHYWQTPEPHIVGKGHC
jgi:hypothetical protein